MLRAIMGISARAISLADRPQRAMWVTRVRMRREDRSSISFLADPGVSRRYKRSEGERGSKKKLLHRSLLSIWPVSFGRAAGVQWKARHCGRATALDYSVGAGDLLDGVSEDPPIQVRVLWCDPGPRTKPLHDLDEVATVQAHYNLAVRAGAQVPEAIAGLQDDGAAPSDGVSAPVELAGVSRGGD